MTLKARISSLKVSTLRQKAVSRGEFEALKRFGDYEELRDGTLMRIEGEKEFRIYCEDVKGFPFGLITPGFCSMLSEAYDRMHPSAAR
jgi:hypothetical protein